MLRSKHSAQIGFIFAIVLLCLHYPTTQAKDIKIGINAFIGHAKTLNHWQPLRDYLIDEVGVAVKLQPIQVANIVKAAEKGATDFVFANPVQSVMLREKVGALPLVTLDRKGSGSQFAGLIITRQDSGIKTIEDMRGKKALSLKFRVAAGAYLFQAYHLHQKGIDIHDNFFSSFLESRTQPGVVLAVHKGIVDVGFIRTGVLDMLEREGKVSKRDFFIIDQANDNSPMAHTTALYPEWYFSAMPNTDKTLSAKIKTALLRLQPEDDVAQKTQINGFVEPLPMQPLIDVLQTMRVKPFE